MPDLGILEILIVFFLFLPLTRPFVKAFTRIGGFVYFPPLALLCTLGIFPSYGFRPEALPLLLYAVLLNILNLQELKAKIYRLSYSDFQNKNPFVFLLLTALLVCAALPALYFLPRKDAEESGASRVMFAYDTVNKNEYFLRFYEEEAGRRQAASKPLLLIVPPVTGSLMLTDDFCESFSMAGFDTVSFSRRAFDIPAAELEGGNHYGDKRVIKNLIVSQTGAWEDEDAYKAAVFLEEERKKDINFILSFLEANVLFDEVFILGYGAGASALSLLFTDDTFILSHPKVSAGAGLEARLYSLFSVKSEEGGKGENDDLPVFQKVLEGIKNLFYSKSKVELNSSGIRGLGSAGIGQGVDGSAGESAGIKLPLLLIEDNKIYDGAEAACYAAVFEFYRSSKGVVKLRTFSGNPALYCTNIDETYPVFACLFSVKDGEEGRNKLFHMILNFFEGITDYD